MSDYSVRNCALALVLLVPAACGEMPTTPSRSPEPSFKPARPGPSYTVLTPSVLPGWTPFNPLGINSQHLAVGTVNPGSNTSSMAARAAVWRAGTGDPPEVLPVPAGETWSVAIGISEAGVIGGHIWPAAVLWRPNGSGWTIVPRHDRGVVNGVAPGGEAVGTVFFDEARMHPQPVIWDAAGAMTVLPMPASGQWTSGEAMAINAQGDISGTFRDEFQGGAYVYGALWVREGSGYVPLVMQTGPARGLSNRMGSDQLYVTASGVRDAWRHRFTRNSGGAWISDSVYVSGTAEGMNAGGDFVGTMRRGKFSSTGVPYLFTVGGAEITLPIPKNATGTASGISGDSWITGTINGVGVVWKP